jgi:adenylosuccinate synthase
LKSTKTIKFATHQVPSGVIFGVPSIIGKGCVVDLSKLQKEIETIASQLGKTYDEIASLIVLAKEAHLILPSHIERDQKNNAVGTTGCGIGPAYSDKALRVGARVEELFTDSVKVESLKHFITGDNKVVGVRVQSIKEMVMPTSGVVVMEGAQGFYLDPSEGDYPFVTSSDCTVSAACTYGFPLQNMIPVCCTKAYTTYVGARAMEKNFTPDNYHCLGELLRLIGHEYGVTTGRRRQCIPLNLDQELYALKTNQGSIWIVSKSDVLVEYQEALDELKNCLDNGTPVQSQILQDFMTKVNDVALYQEMIEQGAFTLIHEKQKKKFSSWDAMKGYIINVMTQAKLPGLQQILWWDSPSSEITVQ